ncbi:MAG TPA: hypothetical protein VGC36_02160 [Rhizomicrobium sp.]
MRFILAAGLIALSVGGCDINTTPKTAKVDCNCTVPPAPPPPDSDAYAPPPQDRGYRHREHWHGHHGHGGRAHYGRREYAEMSVFTYDYHSRSTSYTTGGHGGGSGGVSVYAYAAAGAGAYAGAGAHAGGYAGDAAHGGDGFHVVERGWRDGYGRLHDGGASTGDPAHYETGDATAGDPHETGGDERGRLHPWHGYDADCPDPAHHQR